MSGRLPVGAVSALLLVSAVVVGFATARYGWTGDGYGELPEFTATQTPTAPVTTPSSPLPGRSAAIEPIDAATPDPTVERTTAPASRATRTAEPDHSDLTTTALWALGDWDRYPASVQRSARCIADHESWNGDRHGRRLWTAENDAGSSATGFAQWVSISWRAQTQRAGIGEQYRRAKDAPPRTQAAVFAYQALNHGLYPWKGTGCPGTE